jgi:acyl-CoA thioesterase-2
VSDAASPRESFVEILELERVGEGEFIARLEDFWGASQGGDALARAALAAAGSCPGLELRSLNARYLCPLPAATPLRLRVERLADADSSATREVRIEADGLLCHVTAGFAAPGSGTEYQDVAPSPALPDPDRLPSTWEQAQAEGWSDYARGPIEFRRAHPRVWPDPTGETSGGHVEWVRPRAPLPDDPRLHMAALVFLADFYSHWPFERRIGRNFAYGHFQTLDHALWLQRTQRWNDWWLLESSSEVSHAGCALSRRRIFTREGVLLASAAQSALVATL